jgi:hypothetical protein
VADIFGKSFPPTFIQLNKYDYNIYFQAILPPGAKPADHLQADFTDEAMGSLEGSSNEKVVRKKMNKIWKKGVKVCIHIIIHFFCLK